MYRKVLGGLSTTFLYMVKFIGGFLLGLSGCCVPEPGQNNDRKDRNDRCIKGMKTVRRTFAGLATVIEWLLLCVSLGFGVTGLKSDDMIDSPQLRFLARHTSELLLVFGIAATLLFLPWESYARKEKEAPEL